LVILAESIVRDVLDPIFLGKKVDVCGDETMKIIGVEIGEPVNHIV
jgi:hypothetical protein